MLRNVDVLQELKTAHDTACGAKEIIDRLDIYGPLTDAPTRQSALDARLALETATSKLVTAYWAMEAWIKEQLTSQE